MPDSFVISGDKTAAGASVMQVQLNLTFANDPSLTATLYHYDPQGDLLGQVILFSGVGQGTNTANFTNTVFDDNAGTPIQEGGAPFFASYDPQQSLATVFAPSTGMERPGDLEAGHPEQSATVDGHAHSWSLTFQKPLPTTGWASRSPTRPRLGFRIFTWPDQPAVQRGTGRPSAPASSSDEAGQVGGDRGRPLRPVGQHRLRRRRQRRHLEDHRLPDHQPRRADLHPADRLRPELASTSAASPSSPRTTTRTSRSSSPPPATPGGQNDTGPRASASCSRMTAARPGPSRQHGQRGCQRQPAADRLGVRNHEFVGTTTFKIVVDPQPTPSAR